MMKNAVEVARPDRRPRRARGAARPRLRSRDGVTGLLGPVGCGKSTLMRALVGVQQSPAAPSRSSASPPAVGRCATGSATSPRPPACTTTSPSPRTCASSPGCSASTTARSTGRSRRSTSTATRDAGRRPPQRRPAVAGQPRGRPARQPDLLVLDEPTVGLDPVLRRDLWALFHRLADRGAAVLVSSHVMDEAERCDRLLLMREGALIADGTPAAIRAGRRRRHRGGVPRLVERSGGMNPRITLAVAGARARPSSAATTAPRDAAGGAVRC